MISAELTGVNEVMTIDESSLKGEVSIEDGVIDFRGVSISTPNGDTLVPDMTFQVTQGMNCLITGPNGCGKSSLFRVLGGLWPVFAGKLVKPTARNMFYVPQKPYLPLGTLRDQVIYPDSYDNVKRMKIMDSELVEYLKVVHLDYLIEREGGWDSVRDWYHMHIRSFSP